MTDYEAELAARMWADGRSCKEIGDVLCFSPGYIRAYAKLHRDMFPYRHGRKNRAPDIDLWHERIAAGRVSYKKAARTLGIPETTMRRWQAEWEAER